jgi:hypothetical protein
MVRINLGAGTNQYDPNHVLDVNDDDGDDLHLLPPKFRLLSIQYLLCFVNAISLL